MVYPNNSFQQNSLEQCGILFSEADLNLYNKNAFRILGVPVNACSRQINRESQKLYFLADTDNRNDTQEDIIFPLTPLPDQETIRNALQRLRDPKLRLIDEFFWFWPTWSSQSNINEIFISNMKAGAYRQILENGKHITDPITCHNLAVLSHALAIEMEREIQLEDLTEEQKKEKTFYWNYAYSKWKICLEPEAVWSAMRDRVREINDPRLTTGFVRRIRSALPVILLLINVKRCIQALESGDPAETDSHFQLIHNAGMDSAHIHEAIQRGCAPIREQLKIQCQAIKSKLEDKTEDVETRLQMFLAQTHLPLSVINVVTKKGTPYRETVNNDVAQTILECLIAASQDIKESKKTIELLQQAYAIAETESVRQRILDNIRLLKDRMECVPCWFCDDYLARGATNLRWTIRSKENGEPVTIEIPRCARCQNAHQRIRQWTAVGNCIGGGSAIALAWFALGSLTGSAFWITLFFCAALGIALGSVIGRAIGRKRFPDWIKPESAKEEFPAARKHFKEQWNQDGQPESIG